MSCLPCHGCPVTAPCGNPPGLLLQYFHYIGSCGVCHEIFLVETDVRAALEAGSTSFKEAEEILIEMQFFAYDPKNHFPTNFHTVMILLSTVRQLLLLNEIQVDQCAEALCELKVSSIKTLPSEG